MHKPLQDLRYGLRMMRKAPGFTAVAVLSLALGIGANTAIFTVINAALLKPLAFPEENRLMVLQETRAGEAGEKGGVSYRNFADWRAQSRSFESLAIVANGQATLTGEGEPARVPTATASADIFRVLRVNPLLGRPFTADEELTGGSGGLNAIILSHDCWQRRFASDPKIIGRRVTLDGQAYNIVGVMPAGLFPLQSEPVEFWLTPAANGDPLKSGTANGSRGYRAYDAVIGRLKPNVAASAAQSEMDAIARSLSEQYPDSNGRSGVRVAGLRDLLTAQARPLLLLLLGIVGAVLLIACANVAGLLLARTLARQRELAIRTALGAGRATLVAQLLTESLLLSLMGGLAGLLLSVWCVEGVQAILPADLPHLAGLAPDWRVLLFTFGTAILTGLLCGLGPALTATRMDVSGAIKEGGRGTAGVTRGRWRNALVVGEFALALILLVGAGLLVNSFLRLQRVNPGFRTQSILTAQLVLSSDRYLDRSRSPERINAFLNSLTDRLKQLPGVRSVSYAQSVPLTSIENNTTFDIVERPTPQGQKTTAQLRFIGLNYFQTLGVPQVAGRDFTPRDDPHSLPVVILNEAFVRQYFQGESPIGKKLKLGWGGDAPKEVVGVVGDVRHRSLSDTARPEMYVPQAQFANAGITLLVRSETNPESLSNAVGQAVHALDPELPLTDVKTLDQFRTESVAVPRFNTFLLSLFAGLALLLTVVGLYGVISYSVSQRTQEFGIRLALGAAQGDVLRLVIGQGLKLVALGVAFGLVGAVVVTRLMRGLLYEVSTTDPLTFAGVALLLTLVAVAACWIPARRAAKTDPMVALRCE